MNCDDVKRNLLLFIDKDLNPEQMSRTEKHLDECSSCSLDLKRMHQIYEWAGSNIDPIPENPYVFTRIMSKIARRREEQSTPLFQFRPALLAAAVVFPLVAGVLLGYSAHDGSLLIKEGREAQVKELNNMLTTPGYASVSGYEAIMFDEDNYNH